MAKNKFPDSSNYPLSNKNLFKYGADAGAKIQNVLDKSGNFVKDKLKKGMDAALYKGADGVEWIRERLFKHLS